MSRKTAFAAAFALALVAPGALAAQTCLGYASFGSGPVQAAAGASFADDVTIYGVGIGVGAVNGGFIGGQIGRVSIEIEDADDQSATAFAVNGGWQVPLGTPTPTRAVQLCPIAGFSYMDGEIDEAGVTGDFNESNLSIGGAIGVGLTTSEALTIVPFAAVTWNRSSGELNSNVIDLEYDGENYGAFDFGVGFVANEWITIRPSMSIPFSEPKDFEVDDVFSLNFTFNFGRSR